MMNAYRVGDDQKPSVVSSQAMKGDVGIPQAFLAKKKKGVSDPRFKRIISPELNKNNETDAVKTKLPDVSDNPPEDDVSKDKVISLIKPPKNFSLYAKKLKENSPPDSAEMITKDPGLHVSNAQHENNSTNLKKYENNFKQPCKTKKEFKTDLKRSVSDCTLHRTNIYANENNEDLVRPCPSGSRVTSCTNSGKGYNPDKRRSVVTVIGQTQTRPFNELLEEINQRRKLAKELDKHALCEGITESNETQMGVKNLVAKVDFVLPDGKVIYSTEKVYLCKDKHKDWEGCLARSRQNFEDEYNKRRDMIPERDSSISQVDKKSRPKHWSKKLMGQAKESTPLKESIKYLSPKMLWVFLLIVFCLGCAFASIGFVKPLHTYYYFNRLFSPKTIPWYEKLLF